MFPGILFCYEFNRFTLPVLNQLPGYEKSTIGKYPIMFAAIHLSVVIGNSYSYKTAVGIVIPSGNKCFGMFRISAIGTWAVIEAELESNFTRNPKPDSDFVPGVIITLYAFCP